MEKILQTPKTTSQQQPKEKKKFNKEQHLYNIYLSNLQRNGIAHTVISHGNTKTVICSKFPDRDFYLGNFESGKWLHIIKLIRTDFAKYYNSAPEDELAQYEKYRCPIYEGEKDAKKDISNYSRITGYQIFSTVPCKPEGILHEIDIKGAYVFLALQLGFITQETFDYIERMKLENPTEAGDIKMAALTAIGSINKTHVCKTYDHKGNLTVEHIVKYDHYFLQRAVAGILAEFMREITKDLYFEFWFVWTDAVLVSSLHALKKIEKRLSYMNFQYKIRKNLRFCRNSHSLEIYETVGGEELPPRKFPIHREIRKAWDNEIRQKKEI